MIKDKNHYLSTLKKIPTKKAIIIGVIIIAAAISAVSFFGNKKLSLRDLITVESKNIKKTVMSSGKVVSATDLKLSFQNSDIVRSINVKVGDKVKEGTVLATLSNAGEVADVTRARGVLLGAQARYRKLAEGASSSDVIAAEDALSKAEKTQDRLVDNARRTLYSDDLIAEVQRTDMDQTKAPIITGLFTGTEETSYNLYFKQSSQTLEFSGSERGSVPVLSLQQQLGGKGLYVSYPVTTYSFNDEWIVKIPNKNGRNYTSNLNAYNSSIATRDEVLGALKSKIDILKTKARTSDLDAAEADILVARAGVASAEAVLEKTIVRAPASGTITKIDIKQGDLVESNKPVITLQDVSNLYVESNVNESDIIGVVVGQNVEITFEAFGKDKIFSGELALVDLGATTNESVVNYKVKVLLKDTTQVRSGMTADLKIITLDVPDSIAIPTRYINEKDGQSYVNVVLDEKDKEVRKQNVILGERGDGGVVIIKDGLKLGDKIAIVDEQE